jgi:hypothetical protein
MRPKSERFGGVAGWKRKVEQLRGVSQMYGFSRTPQRRPSSMRVRWLLYSGYAGAATPDWVR